MSFVDWVSTLALLVVCLSGLGVGVFTLVRRRAIVEVQGVNATGVGAVLLGLVYLAGAAVAGLASVLILTERLK